MKIPLEFYEQLRGHIVISDVIRQKVPLTKRGAEYLGLCPFHKEKTPSFTVNNIKQFYHCFGCGSHGDVIRFVANANGLSYQEAAITLANEYGLKVPRLSKLDEKIYEESEDIYSILQKAVDFFKNQLSAAPINYLHSRKIDSNLIKEFDIGFASEQGKLIEFFKRSNIPISRLVTAGLVSQKNTDKPYEVFQNRIIFPIKNIYNKIVGFGGRVINDSMPKYINSPETLIFRKNEILYGEHKAISAAYKKNYIILVEGYLDVISLWAAGFVEVVASLGTAVNTLHIKKLWKYCDEIILCLDADTAGIKASEKIINLVLPLVTPEKNISFIHLPRGHDPYDAVNQNGAEFFAKLVNNRISLSNKIWQIKYQGAKLFTPEQRASFQTELANYVDLVTNQKLRSSYKKFFSDMMWHNVIKNNSNKTAKTTGSNIIELMPENFSELELIERGLCSILLYFPQIINEEHIQNFFLDTDFRTQNLRDFKWWFFEEFGSREDLTSEKVIEEIKNSRFYGLYDLLLKSNNVFNITFSKKINYVLLFEIIQKKYYLVLLKEECHAIANNARDDQSFEKIKRYSEEILKISNELQRLTESFSTVKNPI